MLWGWGRKNIFHLFFLNVFHYHLNSCSQATGKLETGAHRHILPSKYLLVSSSSWSSIANVHVKIKVAKIHLQTLLLPWHKLAFPDNKTLHEAYVQFASKHRPTVAVSKMSWVRFENIRPWAKWEFKDPVTRFKAKDANWPMERVETWG